MRMLQLTERQLADGATEIEVDGELDLSVIDQLQRAIDEAGPGSTLIDLRHCTFIDSTGIAVILRAHQQREKDGGRIVVHSLSPAVLRIFTITGLIGNGLVFADRDEASADIGG
jgi:stage II sporulation protein AA (anti-sigma F factor antagonist)